MNEPRQCFKMRGEVKSIDTKDFRVGENEMLFRVVEMRVEGKEHSAIFKGNNNKYTGKANIMLSCKEGDLVEVQFYIQTREGKNNYAGKFFCDLMLEELYLVNDITPPKSEGSPLQEDDDDILTQVRDDGNKNIVGGTEYKQDDDFGDLPF